MSSTTRLDPTHPTPDPAASADPTPASIDTQIPSVDDEVEASMWSAVEEQFARDLGLDPATLPGHGDTTTPDPTTTDPASSDDQPGSPVVAGDEDPDAASHAASEEPAPVDGGGADTTPDTSAPAGTPTPVTPVTPVLPVTDPTATTTAPTSAPTVDTWYASLPPAQQAAVAQALGAPTTPPVPGAIPTPPAPSLAPSVAPSTPTTFDPAALAVLDDAIPGFSANYAAQQAQLAQLHAELAATRSYIDQQATVSAASANETAMAQIGAARDQWSVDHPEFAPSDVTTLLSEAAQTVNYNGLVARHNGNHALATRDALDIAMRNNPLTHDAWMRAEFAKLQQTQQTIDTRKARASALGHAPGAVNHEPPQRDVRSMSDQDIQRAIATELAANRDA